MTVGAFICGAVAGGVTAAGLLWFAVGNPYTAFALTSVGVCLTIVGFVGLWAAMLELEADE